MRHLGLAIVVIAGSMAMAGAQQSFQFSVNGLNSHEEKARNSTYKQLDIDLSAGNGSVAVTIEYRQTGIPASVVVVAPGEKRTFTSPKGATIKKVTIDLITGVVAVGDGKLY